MTGTPKSEDLGSAWMEIVHPEDRDPCQKKWQECMRSGQTFEIDYRLRDKAGGYRWYLDRAFLCGMHPGTSSSGLEPAPISMTRCGISSSSRKQIKARTSELFDANTCGTDRVPTSLPATIAQKRKVGTASWSLIFPFRQKRRWRNFGSCRERILSFPQNPSLRGTNKNARHKAGRKS